MIRLPAPIIALIKAGMEKFLPYIGDLHDVLAPHWAGVVLVLCSVVCGMIVGAEREIKQKPAGLRTVTLICVGSTIFTLASIMISSVEGVVADRGRIAAGIVTGVGFLGAGAIIRERGTIVGLTTGATIWTVAAIGVVVGTGYAAAGGVLALLVVGMLTMIKWIQRAIGGRCQFTHCRLVYHPEHGKTRLRALQVLDNYHIPDAAWDVRQEEDKEVMDIRYCHYHRHHRAFLTQIVETPALIEIQHERAPRRDEIDLDDES